MHQVQGLNLVRSSLYFSTHNIQGLNLVILLASFTIALPVFVALYLRLDATVRP